MRPEIEASVGAQMSQEIEGLLAGMSGILEENFGQLRSRLDELEENIIKAINTQKNEEIQKLEQQLATKDKQI